MHETLQSFLKRDSKQYLRNLDTKHCDYWQQSGERRALEFFHFASENIPAYKDFLKHNKIKASSVKTIVDFSKVPYTDKKNYINKYPLAKRLPHGKLAGNNIVAVSSGTTGTPKYWPRRLAQDTDNAFFHELLFKKFYNIDKKSTLLIMGFPLGVYVSGIAEFLSTWMLSLKGYPLTVASVGYNKAEVLKLVKEFGHKYDQIIFEGHPFYIKDCLETGKEQGINWKKLDIKLMFCSEGFSETWRKYVGDLIGGDIAQGDALNTYGSTEGLLMAFESPLTIAIRKLYEPHPAKSQEVFGEKQLPYLFQYDPTNRFFQSEKDELLLTSRSGVPMVRYNMHDAGQIYHFDTLVKQLEPKDKHLSKLIADAWELPFVSLKGRSDLTAVFYHANIYPEHVKAAINSNEYFHKFTGKFALRQGYLKNMDEFLEINIELKPRVKVKSGYTKALTKHIYEKLKQINMEFNFISTKFLKKSIPRVVLRSYQYPKYFKPGVKPRYVVR